MARFFIYLSYDGTAYHGWQVQPNGTSVQETLQKALSTIVRADTEVVGAGRTDAGVHARMMVAHFDMPEGCDIDPARLGERLNRLLPQDIAIDKVVPVVSEAHARFSATSRTYQYFISTHKSPFNRRFAWYLRQQPDIDAMNKAAAVLLKQSDFTSFSKLHTDVKTNICRVTQAEWQHVDAGTLCFTITADRFLRNMVRAIVGTLLEVGMHKASLRDFENVIAQKDRCAAGSSVPAQGLFLTHIGYPDDLFIKP